MKRQLAAVSVLLVMSSAGTAQAQDLTTLVSPNPENLGYFGCSVSGAGDVNNDGYDDVIVGTLREDTDGVTDAGTAYVFSGPAGELLFPLASPDPQDLGIFGAAVSGAGDVNGDGFDDVTFSLIVGTDQDGVVP